MIDNILNTTSNRLGSTSSRSGSSLVRVRASTNEGATSSSAQEMFTITIPTGQVLTVNKYDYEEIKQWIALYNSCREFALENGIGIPTWDWVLSKGSRAMPELQQLAEQKRQEDLKIKTGDKNTIIQKYAEERSNQKQENTTAPQNNDVVKEEKGSSLVVPGIILAVGILGAILLTKKSKRR